MTSREFWELIVRLLFEFLVWTIFHRFWAFFHR